MVFALLGTGLGYGEKVFSEESALNSLIETRLSHLPS